MGTHRRSRGLGMLCRVSRPSDGERVRGFDGDGFALSSFEGQLNNKVTKTRSCSHLCVFASLLFVCTAEFGLIGVPETGRQLSNRETYKSDKRRAARARWGCGQAGRLPCCGVERKDGGCRRWNSRLPAASRRIGRRPGWFLSKSHSGRLRAGKHVRCRRD